MLVVLCSTSFASWLIMCTRLNILSNHLSETIVTSLHFWFPKLKNSTWASELSTHQGGNFASISVTLGKLELEQMLKQMTFTRSVFLEMQSYTAITSYCIREHEMSGHLPPISCNMFTYDIRSITCFWGLKTMSASFN